MTDDDTLVRFLRTHRLNPPPPSPELESRLMTKLDHVSHSFPWLRVVAGLGLVASLLGFSQLGKWQTATNSNSVDPEQLETSLILNWEVATAQAEDFTIDFFNY